MQEIEKLLKSPELKLEMPADTRWLTHDNACQILARVFPAVCVSLSREAEECSCCWTLQCVRKYNFVASLYMICDVLPAVSRLCFVLQSSCIDLSQLHSLVSYTIETLELLCVSTGPRLNTLDAELENSLAHSEIDVRPESKEQFKTRVYVPFIKALISHIKDRLPDTGISFLAAKLPSSQEEMVSQKYGEAHVYTLEKYYG